MRVALIRASSDLEDLDGSRFAIAANACFRQIYCPEMHLDSACYEVRFYPDRSKVGADGWPFDLFASIETSPPEQGIGGYHDESGDMPYAPIFTRPSGPDAPASPLYMGDYSVFADLMHEGFEARENLYVNRWVDMPGALRPGAEQCAEACDMVEGPTEQVQFGPGAGDVVSCPNFALPRYWDRQAAPLEKAPGPQGGAARFDRLGALAAAFTVLATGYRITRTGGAGGQESQEFGERMPAERRAFKALHGRFARRGAKTSLAAIRRAA